MTKMFKITNQSKWMEQMVILRTSSSENDFMIQQVQKLEKRKIVLT